MTLFLGIDGGGSKTTLLLEDDTGTELSRIETGPSNWLSVSPSQAQQSIADGVAQLPARPDIVCGGFAGAGRPAGLQFYRDSLEALLPNAQIFIETDAFVSYIGAIGIEPGVLLIAGTGSIGIGRCPDGTMIRVGGWGPFFSDEGSGYWIGREAIRIALRAHDAGETPEFVSLIRSSLGMESILNVVSAWTVGKLDVRIVASLASVIFQYYPAEPANRILTAAAGHLREIAKTAVGRVGLPDCHRSISGSVGSSPIMRHLLDMDLQPPQHSPERGAIIWARSKLQKPAFNLPG